jgi:hypothetical protein
MKLIRIFLISLTGLFVMTGCNGSDPEPEMEPETETVFDPLVEALDKAEATQDLELERKRRIDAALEKQ